jgi:glutamate-1-semialdehyde 2,1-aminomutase
VFQAGTFSGHPVTMAAGLETLKFAAEHDVYDHVNGLGDKLREGLTEVVREQAPEYTVVGTDSMFKVVFTRGGDGQTSECGTGCRQDPDCEAFDACPKNGGDVGNAAVERWNRVFRPQVLDDGVMLSQNQFESQFVSYAHTEEDVERTVQAYRDAL